MARGRLLNRTVSASLKFHNLSSDTCRLLATWIIAHLDMNGVFYGSATMVHSQVFPRRADVSLDDVESYLCEMETQGLMGRFEANGDVWQCWPKFGKNQPNLRRDRERPEYPIPPEIDGSLPAAYRQNDGSIPAEEKLSKEKPSKENMSGADAPSANADPPVSSFTSFKECQDKIEAAKGKPGGRQAVVHGIIESLYPGLDPPDYGYIVKAAKRMGGFTILAEWLWRCNTLNVKGDVLAYVYAAWKDRSNGNHSTTHNRTTNLVPLATGFIDEPAREPLPDG